MFLHQSFEIDSSSESGNIKRNKQFPACLLTAGNTAIKKDKNGNIQVQPDDPSKDIFLLTKRGWKLDINNL